MNYHHTETEIEFSSPDYAYTPIEICGIQYRLMDSPTQSTFGWTYRLEEVKEKKKRKGLSKYLLTK